MGVILFEMLSGRLPFIASNAAVLYKVIVAGEYKMPPDVAPIAQVSPPPRHNFQHRQVQPKNPCLQVWL